MKFELGGPFGPLKPFRLDLDSGLTVIVGDHGSGKSFLFKAFYIYFLSSMGPFWGFLKGAPELLVEMLKGKEKAEKVGNKLILTFEGAHDLLLSWGAKVLARAYGGRLKEEEIRSAMFRHSYLQILVVTSSGYVSINNSVMKVEVKRNPWKALKEAFGAEEPWLIEPFSFLPKEREALILMAEKLGVEGLKDLIYPHQYSFLKRYEVVKDGSAILAPFFIDDPLKPFEKLLGIKVIEGGGDRLLCIEKGEVTSVQRCSSAALAAFSLAIASANSPMFMFVEEPEEGLDPTAQRAMASSLLNVSKRRGVIVLTGSPHVYSTLAKIAEGDERLAEELGINKRALRRKIAFYRLVGGRPTEVSPSSLLGS